MPTLFDNVQFAKYTPTYVSGPIEQFAKTADILNQRYEQNKDAKDQLDIAMSNIKIEDADSPILKARISKTKDIFKNTLDKGDFENAGTIVKSAFKDMAMDNGLKAATENYATRQATKEELRKRFDSKLLSSTQYQDRINRFNQYDGVGKPDELGFYNPYTFDMGVNRVDLDEFAHKALSSYQPDTASVANTSRQYSTDANGNSSASMGIATSQVTNAYKVSNGVRGKLVLENQMKNNPDVMAYVNDEVRIHNENNPNNPTTTDKFLSDYSTDYIMRYANLDTSTVTQELGEADEFIRSQYGKKQPDAKYGSIEQIPNDGKQPYAIETMKDYALREMDAKNGANKPYDSWGSLWDKTKGLFRPSLTEFQQTQYNNLLTRFKSPEKVAAYLDRVDRISVNNVYAKYDSERKAETDKETAITLRNLQSRLLYNIITGEVIKGVDMLAQIGEDEKAGTTKGYPDFAIVGTSSANNTYVDLTGMSEFAKPEIISYGGQHYAISPPVDELNSYEHNTSLLYNALTQGYRSNMPAFVTNPDTKEQYAITSTMTKNGRYMDVSTTSGKRLGGFIDNGDEEKVTQAFKNLVEKN